MRDHRRKEWWLDNDPKATPKNPIRWGLPAPVDRIETRTRLLDPNRNRIRSVGELPAPVDWIRRSVGELPAPVDRTNTIVVLSAMYSGCILSFCCSRIVSDVCGTIDGRSGGLTMTPKRPQRIRSVGDYPPQWIGLKPEPDSWTRTVTESDPLGNYPPQWIGFADPLGNYPPQWIGLTPLSYCQRRIRDVYQAFVVVVKSATYAGPSTEGVVA